MTAFTVVGTTTDISPRAPWRGRNIPGAVVAAVGGPLLLAITNAIVNFTPGYAAADSWAAELDVFDAHPGAVSTGVGFGLAACALIVPGAWAVSGRLAGRAPWLSAIGGWLMATGYVFATVLSLTTIVGLGALRSGVDRDVLATALDAVNASPWYGVVTMLFGIPALLGAVLLGVAMLRRRGGLPAWVGWVLIAAEPVRMVGLITGIRVGPPLASLMITVAFGAVFLLPRPRRAADVAGS